MGTLRLALTDAPACGLEHVYVTVQGLRIHPSSSAQPTDAGWHDIPLGSARRIDLLTLTNGALEELGATKLPSGRYEQLRLVLGTGSQNASRPANAVVRTESTGELPLAIASEDVSGIKIAANVAVTAAGQADLVLDFDACKSIVSAADTTYQLKPFITALPRSAGGIEGKVDAALAGGQTTVSAQQGGVSVRATRPDRDGRFRIPYLEAGTYSLVVTSDGRATGVVTNVPVEAGMRTVGTMAAPVTLPASAMSEITGQLVTKDAEDTTSTAATVFTDALARAAQVLASGEPIEVRTEPVDGSLGKYRLKVPTAPLVKGSYRTSGEVSFVTEPASAGLYTVDIVMTPGTSTTSHTP